jgi:hypothetical protein
MRLEQLPESVGNQAHSLVPLFKLTKLVTGARDATIGIRLKRTNAADLALLINVKYVDEVDHGFGLVVADDAV